MAISPQRLTIYLYSTHRPVTFAIAQLSCYDYDSLAKAPKTLKVNVINILRLNNIQLLC